MGSVVSAPVDWVEAVSQLKFPASADRLLRDLMDRNNEGRLLPREQEELAALVEMSERLSLIRADALRLLGQSPA